MTYEIWLLIAGPYNNRVVGEHWGNQVTTNDLEGHLSTSNVSTTVEFGAISVGDESDRNVGSPTQGLPPFKCKVLDPVNYLIYDTSDNVLNVSRYTY